MNNNEQQNNNVGFNPFNENASDFQQAYNQNPISQYKEKYNEQNISGEVDDELLMAYMGSCYRSVTSGLFNFWVLLFGASYFFYKKMYIQGFIYVILETVLTIIFPPLGILVWLGACFLANGLYRSNASSDIANIIQNNPNLSKMELKTICIKQGGNSFLAVILGGIVSNAARSFIIILLFSLGFGRKYIETIRDYLQTPPPMAIVETISKK